MNLREAMTRNPSADQTPLDKASFYVEALKYGPRAGKVERTPISQVAVEMEGLLRDAGITSMSGRELVDAAIYYGASFARQAGMPFELVLSLWLDGLMHGIAFKAGLEGPTRNPVGQ